MDFVQCVAQGPVFSLEQGGILGEQDAGGGFFVPDPGVRQVTVAFLCAEHESRPLGHAFDCRAHVLEADGQVARNRQAEGPGDEGGQVGGYRRFAEKSPSG